MIGRFIASENFAIGMPSIDPLQYNRENVYGVIYQHVRPKLRNMPFTDSQQHPELKVYCTAGLHDIWFYVLAKYKGADQKTWYFIELMDEVTDYYNPTLKVPKGQRLFFQKEQFDPVLFVYFKKFLRDLKYLNFDLDVSTTSSHNDNLAQRITRIRQRGHESDVSLFDKVIGKDVSDSIYKDEIPYSNTPSVSIALPDSTQSLIVSTDIQMFRDYEVVRFSSLMFGEIDTAEIQHMFVGLDVINNLMRNFNITYYLVPISIPNNVYYSLFSGDIGSVAAEVANENSSTMSGPIRESIEILKKRTNPRAVVTKDDLFSYYQKTRFAIYDQLGDLFAFGLNDLMKRYNHGLSPSKALVYLFEEFDRQGTYKRVNSIKALYSFTSMNLNYSPVDSLQNPAPVGEISYCNRAFAMLWYDSVKNNFSPNGAKIAELDRYAHKSMDEFAKTIEFTRKKIFK